MNKLTILQEKRCVKSTFNIDIEERKRIVF